MVGGIAAGDTAAGAIGAGAIVGGAIVGGATVEDGVTAGAIIIRIAAIVGNLTFLTGAFRRINLR
jgi:hypothetical protein